jgi:nucleotide-binding universal stress UspA family protein
MCASRHLVVGVDGSVASEVALRWALAEAARTASAVDVVAVWHWRPVHGSVIAPTTAESLGDRTERVVGEMVADARTAYPEVPLTCTVVEGDTVDVLIHAALDGDLIVLGSHRHGRAHHAVLGSTIDACVRQAACPVVAVPAAVPEPAPARTRRARATAQLATAVVGVRPINAAAGLVTPRDVITVVGPRSNGDW